jgi:hypothetical protein
MGLTDLFTPGVREGGTAGFQEGKRLTNLRAAITAVSPQCSFLDFSIRSTNRDSVSSLGAWSNGFLVAAHARLDRSPFCRRLH